MSRAYTPRRASSRWLEGAPPYILDCLNSGPNNGTDRYTVLFTGSYLIGDGRNTRVQYLGTSAEMGVSSWGELDARQAAGLRYRSRKVRWADLPETIRAYILRQHDSAEAETIKARRVCSYGDKRGELLTMGDGSHWFHPYGGGAPTRLQEQPE